MMTLRKLTRLVSFCAGLLFGGFPLVLVAQEVTLPDVPLVPEQEPLDQRAQRQMADGAAWSALHAGLPTIARDLFRPLVEGEGAQPNDEEVQGYVASLIATDSIEPALRILDAHPSDEPWWLLLHALAGLEQGQDDEAKTFLSRAEMRGKLDPALRPWLDLAKGMLATRGGDAAAAAEFYSSAMDSAPQTLQPQIDLLLLRNQLRQGSASESVIVDLRQRMRDMQGQRGGFEAARLLAIALHQVGRDAEAIPILEEQLRYVSVKEGDLREQLLLLLGSIAGPGSGRGRVALQQVLMNPSAPRRLLNSALSLLASSSDTEEGRAAFTEILGNIIETSPGHPLMDELLLLRAHMALEKGNYDAASADAQRLLDLYPASRLRRAALRCSAYIAFERQPPQYRTAASLLETLRGELPPGPERAKLGVLMADSFFLNGDYVNAAVSYEDVLDEPVEDRSVVFYQMILANLRAGRIEDARAALDALPPDSGINAEQRWRAEWNLVHAMRSNGDSEAAFSRLASLLAEGVAAAPPASLRLRLMWLEAQLSIDAGQPEETPGRCDAILASLDAVPQDVLGPVQRATISSHTLLLEAQAYFLLDQESDAVEALDQLRTQHPESEAAQHSYLVQARYLSQHERLVEAQRLLLALADRYPNSSQAPIALWEAALAAEQRGLDATYREALGLLDRLVSQFPQHYLVFHARLRQGDILRRLNDFNTALLVYEDLINRFPNHPDLYQAWMSRADCYVAQASANPARRSEAIGIYERLMERHDVPVDLRAEASFKWAYSMDRTGDSDRARDAYWTTLKRFTDPEEGMLLGAKGRYWIGRAGIELGQLLEKENDFEEARSVYRLLIASNLPGAALAQARIERLNQPRS